MRIRNCIKIVCILTYILAFTFTLPGQNINDIPLPNGEVSKGEVRFAAFGDTGTGKKPQLKLAEKMAEIQRQTKFSVLIFLGDNIYDDGSPKAIEKKFLKPYGSLFENGVELRGAIGNHDARNENGVLLQQMIFGMGSKTYYSFTKKNNLIEFFGLNTILLAKKKNFYEGLEQLRWFEDKISKSKAHWKITFMHHPLYSSAKRHGFQADINDEVGKVREKLEPILTKHNVQVSLHGHDHVYERTKPQKGVQYFVSGAGGKLREGNLETSSEVYAFGNDQVLSFMLFSVQGSELTFWSIGSEGEILDSGKIQNKYA